MSDGPRPVVCSACGLPIPRADWWYATVWTGPDGIPAVAHDTCLAWIEAALPQVAR